MPCFSAMRRIKKAHMPKNRNTGRIQDRISRIRLFSTVLNPHEREVVAYHEMGHAIVATALPGMDPVHKVSMIPRGVGALGYTMQRPTEDRFLLSRGDLENRLAVLLGRRAAEILVFNEASTGATDDLNKATDIARNMVARFGMDDKLGLATYETPRQTFLGENAFAHFAEREFSEDTAREIDRAVRELTTGAFEKALGVLRKYHSQLERGARMLLEKETLTREELPLLQELQPPIAAAAGAT